MTDKEFVAYVNDKRRQGVSDNRIARSLGMNLAHFLGKLNGSEKKMEEPKVEPVVKMPVKEEKVEKTDKKFSFKKPEKAELKPEEPVKAPAFFKDEEIDE